MQRIIMAVVIWIVFAGGLGLYMNHRAGAVAPREIFRDTRQVSAHYRLEITTTFAAEPDPFALQTETSQAPALLLRMGSREILRITDRMEAGIPLVTDPLTDLLPGDNEIWFQASPPLEAAAKSQALRIRILENGQPLSDHSFWSEAGGNVTGTVRFTVPAEKDIPHDQT